MAYFRRKLKFWNGELIGLQEEISEEDAMKVLKEHWNNPKILLDRGQGLTVNGHLYYKEGD